MKVRQWQERKLTFRSSSQEQNEVGDDRNLSFCLLSYSQFKKNPVWAWATRKEPHTHTFQEDKEVWEQLHFW